MKAANRLSSSPQLLNQYHSQQSLFRGPLLLVGAFFWFVFLCQSTKERKRKLYPIQFCQKWKAVFSTFEWDSVKIVRMSRFKVCRVFSEQPVITSFPPCSAFLHLDRRSARLASFTPPQPTPSPASGFLWFLPRHYCKGKELWFLMKYFPFASFTC